MIESPQDQRELVVELRDGELFRLQPTLHGQSDAELAAAPTEPL